MTKSNKGSESQSLPLDTYWFRAAAGASTEGDDIVAKGDIAWYWPALIKDLPGDFASVVDASGATRFLSEYGPLKLPVGLSRARLGLAARMVEVRESVVPILDQARRIARIRRAVALFADTRPEIQKNLVATLLGLWPLNFRLAPGLNISGASHLSLARVKDVIERFILQELNMHLPRSSERAHINVRGEFESVLAFDDLLAVIYRKLFEELMRGKLRLCHECNTVFEWADPRQMYCSKRCGLNLAQRRHRKRQKKEGRV
jgi:hypothetical protein